jgi:hypothetical protein
MTPLISTAATYRYLAERSSSGYRELFVCGTSFRAQSLISDMENEQLTPEEVATAYHIPVDAVLEAADYVHQNEEYLAGERARARHQAIAKGYLRPTP